MRFILLVLVQACVVCGAVEPTRDISAEMRPLVRVRDSVITVVDVMKKMDLVFYQQYPEYRTSTERRLEFYLASWRQVLQDLVERKVIMVFADENKMEVGHGDIREEMEDLFGPNVLLKLYEAGVSMDDAYDMVRQDMMMRRILQFYVRMPAASSITPQKVKERFLEKYSNTTKGDKLSWRILSVHGPENIDSKNALMSVVEALNAKSMTVEDAKQNLPEGLELLVSQPYVTEVEQLAPSMQATLEGAVFHVWTAPYPGKESKKGWVKWNSYLVTSRTPGEKISMNLVENEIVEELMMPLYSEKKKSFIEGLIQKFDVSYCMSQKELDGFQPFHITHVAS